MNANAVARHYGKLTPEERFALILAAGGREEAKQDRLINAGGRITLSMPDHAPSARACLLYTSPSPRDQRGSRMPSSA